MSKVTRVTHIKNDGKMQRPRVLIVDDNGVQLSLFAQRSRWGRNPGDAELCGVEPVFMAYGPQKTQGDQDVLQKNTLKEIVDFAMDPANRIDAVVTDLYEGEEAFARLMDIDDSTSKGRAYTEEGFSEEEYFLLLKDYPDLAGTLTVLDPHHERSSRELAYGFALTQSLKEAGFVGPIAIHTDGEASERTMIDACRNGAIGLFESKHLGDRSVGDSAFAAVIEAIRNKGQTQERDVA